MKRRGTLFAMASARVGEGEADHKDGNDDQERDKICCRHEEVAAGARCRIAVWRTDRGVGKNLVPPRGGAQTEEQDERRPNALQRARRQGESGNGLTSKLSGSVKSTLGIFPDHNNRSLVAAHRSQSQPVAAHRKPRQRKQRTNLEVCRLGERVPKSNIAKEVHAQNRVDKENEEEQRANVDQRRQRVKQCPARPRRWRFWS